MERISVETPDIETDFVPEFPDDLKPITDRFHRVYIEHYEGVDRTDAGALKRIYDPQCKKN